MQKLKNAHEVIIDLSEDKVFSGFLNTQKKSTRATYSAYLRRLKEFTSETGKEILANRKAWATKIFEFQHHLEGKGYSGTYIQSCLGCVRGFFDHHHKPLNLNRQERKRLGKRSRSTEDFYLQLEHLKMMSQFCGSLKEKHVLIVGKSLGFRSIDFVKLNYGQLRSVEDQLDKPPVFLGEIKAQKENTKYYAFLDLDACEVVKQILTQNRDKPDGESVLMTRSKKKHNTYQTMRKEELSLILRSIAKRAGIQTGNRRLRFHCLRKFLSDNLSRFMSESKWKQVVAKEIDESAYVSPESLKEDFERAMPSLLIGNGNGKVKAELEKTSAAVVDQAKELSEMRQIIGLLMKKVESTGTTTTTEKAETDRTEIDTTAAMLKRLKQQETKDYEKT